MERLKLRYIGEDRSMGLRKNRVYKMRGMNSGVYIYLIINGRAVPYTISGFLANWMAVRQVSRNDKSRDY